MKLTKVYKATATKEIKKGFYKVNIQAFTTDFKTYFIEATAEISSFQTKVFDFMIGADKWDIIVFVENLKRKYHLNLISEKWNKEFVEKWKRGVI